MCRGFIASVRQDWGRSNEDADMHTVHDVAVLRGGPMGGTDDIVFLSFFRSFVPSSAFCGRWPGTLNTLPGTCVLHLHRA